VAEWHGRQRQGGQDQRPPGVRASMGDGAEPEQCPQGQRGTTGGAQLSQIKAHVGIGQRIRSVEVGDGARAGRNLSGYRA